MFGLTAALELRRRHWHVTLADTGALPRPTAASTDISKVVRADYGADETHTAMGSASLAGWRQWNRQWRRTLFHEDGFLVLRRGPMEPGGFEHESFHALSRLGFPLRKLDAATLRAEYPAWGTASYDGGYFNPHAGWVESGEVIAQLSRDAQAAGVNLRTTCPFARLQERSSRVVGAEFADGTVMRADAVLMCVGAWTPSALPFLKDVMWATAQPVLHFKVPIPAAWQAPRFPVWAADISRTGWYGFPALEDGTLKIAHHGKGRRVPPDAPRVIGPGVEAQFREFIAATFPNIAHAPLISSHTCLYCDTFDGRFWIDHDPQRPGLVVAAGDSGHAFKFAPVMGALIADVVERVPNPWAGPFAWRSPTAPSREGARAG